MRRNILQKVVLSSKQYEKEEKYWLEKLSGELRRSSFSLFSGKRPGVIQSIREKLPFTCPPAVYNQLLNIGNNSEYGVFIVLSAGLIFLLYKYTGDEDIVIGNPVFKQEEVGEYLNKVVAIRNTINGDMTFKELLVQVKDTLVEANENMNYPLGEIIKRLNLSHADDGAPLFDVMMCFTNIHEDIAVSELGCGTVFSFNMIDNRIDCEIDYNSTIFTPPEIETLSSHFLNCLNAAMMNTDAKISDVEILPDDEKRQILLDFNDSACQYPPPGVIHEIFEEQVRKTPDNCALVYKDEQLTYKKLNERANQLAGVIRKRGLQPNEIVGIMIPRSIDLAVGMIAVLKAGGACFLFDLDTPINRVLTILSDSLIQLLLGKIESFKNISFTQLQDFSLIKVKPYVTASRPQITDLDRLPIPNRSYISHVKYDPFIGDPWIKNTYITMQATRGCPYKCKYCHRIWPKKHVYRSAEHIFSELELYYDMGVRRFSFVDDIFNLNIRNSSRFFELIIRKGLDVKIFFPNGMRGDILTREYIDLMVKAGVINLPLALETASPRLQKLIGKNIKLDKFRENIEYICRNYPHVILSLFTMHGLITETKEEAMMTFDFIKTLHWIHFPYINIMRIYLNTDMEKIAYENGIKKAAIVRSEGLAYHELPETLPFDKNFTMEYQTNLLKEYFLLKERLLNVLPYQLKVLTKDEVVQLYDNYLPTKIKNFNHLLQFLEVSEDELGIKNYLPEDYMLVPGLDQKIKTYFPTVKPGNNALKVLLLDATQFFNIDKGDMFYDLVEPPLGLTYLLTYLIQQLGPKINGKIAKSRIDFDSYSELKRMLQEFNPDVIGIRVLTFYKEFFHKIAAVIRHWGFEVPIIVGGPHATSNFAEILQDTNIDLVVLGEGEITFCEVIKTMINNGGRLPDEEVLRKIPGIAFLPGKTGPIEKPSRQIMILDELNEKLAKESVDNLLPVSLSSDLAFLIYTSGSTGRPKGVMLHHGGVSNHVFTKIHELGIREQDVLCQNLNISFVASIWQFFAPLLTGAKLFIYPEALLLDPYEFFKQTALDNVTIVEVIPTVLNVYLGLLEAGKSRINLDKFRFLVLTGEEVLPILVYKFYSRYRTKLVNAYGQSECSDDTLHYKIPVNTDKERVPIGKPANNTVVYVLDRNLQMQPLGVAGELCISGDGLSAGYINNIELTARRFLPNPFNQGERLFKTGDLVRWLKDGNIEFIGRNDHQVKIRGNRIELREIEVRLLDHEAVNEAVVVVNEDNKGEKYLCAYIVFNGRLDVNEMRNYLLKFLPGYMLPSFFIPLKNIPKTKSGKIDRKNLPEPDAAAEDRLYSKAGDELEEKLVKIWSDVLGREVGTIGLDDNFFNLGGNSLKVVTLISEIHKELNVDISLVNVFNHPTIKVLSGCIREAKAETFESVAPGEKKEYYPLSSMQNRLYFLQQVEKGSLAYNEYQVLYLKDLLNWRKIEKIFETLIARHDSLRTSFIMIKDKPAQKIYDELNFEIERYEECSIGPGGQKQDKEDLIANFIRPFDLSEPPLLRVGLIKTVERNYVLIIDLHHIITDRTSQMVLGSEFFSLFSGDELPALKLQYKDFSQWQNNNKQKELLKQQEEYWLNLFSGEIPVLHLPTDYPRPSKKSYQGAAVDFVLDEEDTKGLKKIANTYDATLYMTVLTILNILLSKLSGQEDIIIGTSLAGRNHADLKNIIGMFVNTMVLRNFPARSQTFEGFLVDVKERTLNAFANREYHFEDLVEKTAVKRDTSRNPIFDVFFVLLNQDEYSANLSELKNRDHFSHTRGSSKFDISFIAVDFGKNLYFKLEYCSALFKPHRIERFIKYFKHITSAVIHSPNMILSQIELISQEQKQACLRIRPISGWEIPASYQQERLWFIDKFESGYLYQASPIYHNIPVILEIFGDLDSKLLERSIQDVMRRHEALRTKIVTVKDIPFQRISETIDFSLSVVHLTGDPGHDVISLALEKANIPFRMDRDILMRALLFRVAKQKFILVWTLHHIIADRYSLGILVKETLLHYQAYLQNRAVDLPGLPFHFASFSQWQHEMPIELEEHLLVYWKNQLKGKLQSLELRTDRLRSLVHTYQSGRQAFKISKKVAQQVVSFAKLENTTNFITLLAAFKVLLHRYTGLDEIVVGTSAANRERQSTEGIIGPIANLLVLRSFISGEQDFHSVVFDLKKVVSGARKHQSMPFDKLVLELNPDIDMSRTALFDVLFQYEESPIQTPEIENLKINVIETNLGWGKYDLNLLIQEEGGCFSCILVYNADYYGESTISRFIGHYLVLLNSLTREPYRQVSRLSLLTGKERSDILGVLNETRATYPENKCLHELFEEVVVKEPCRTAVVFKDKIVTYHALNNHSHRLAEVLIEKGVQVNTIVGVLVDRSVEMITAILGILKSGGAYLPLDPVYPEARMKYMLKDGAVEILITNRKLTGEKDHPHTDPGDRSCERIYVEEVGIKEKQGMGESSYPLPGQDAEEVEKLRGSGGEKAPKIEFLISSQPLHSSMNLAYIIYTSGTTGTPKGAMIEHRNVVQLLCNDGLPFEFSANDVWTMFHSYCFDFSVWEMYGALLYGGKLVVLTLMAARDPEQYLETLKLEKVTVLNQTPTAFYNLLNYELSDPAEDLHIRYVIFGGEALKMAKLREWQNKYPGTKLINMYGITETTVHVTFKELTERDIEKGINNIGKGLPNMRTWVMDSWCNPVPIGVPGELWVGGEGVCRGYLGQLELTGEKFKRAVISHSSLVISSSKKLYPNDQCPMTNDRLYKTGDLARMLENGDLEYLGRLDDQVQVRGFRIELGEIENHLITHRGIKEAVVSAREESNGDIYLCAYYVSDTRHSASQLRKHLAGALPGYMIPNYFIPLERIPLTPNGKVDKQALPDPVIEAAAEYLAPRDEIEKELVRIWTEVLGLAADGISITADFFELGGHSLKATVLVSKIHKEFDVKIPLAEIFQTPTIAGLSGYIKEAEEDRYISIESVEKKEYYFLSSAQRRLYILQQMNPRNTGYNLPCVLAVGDDIEIKKLEETVGRIIERHESLRTSFTMLGDEPVQRIHERVDAALDCREISPMEKKAETLNIGDIMENFVCPFDLSRAPLLRVRFTRGLKGNNLILFDLHHIITDGVSQVVLEEEFFSLYSGEEFPQYRIHYKDFAAWQAQRGQKRLMNQQEEYWVRLFTGEIPILNLPTDFPRPLVRSFEGALVDFVLNEQETGIMKEIQREFDVTLYMAVLAILDILLSKLSGQTDIIVGTPIAGRRHPDLERIIGLFINTLVMRNYPGGEMSFKEFLSVVKHCTLASYDNQEYQFEDLVEKISVTRDTGRNPLFDVLLNIQHQSEVPAGSFTRPEEERYIHRKGSAKFDLTLTVLDYGERLGFNLSYSSKLFKPETIERFIGYFRRLISRLSGNFGQKICSLEMLSHHEKKRLLGEFNDTLCSYPADKAVHELLAEQVERTPDHVALLFEDKKISYRKLNNMANYLAERLRTRGVGPGAVVGMMNEPTLEILAGMIAILKSGGAYLPIDRRYPPTRIAAVTGCGIDLLLTGSEYGDYLPGTCETIKLDSGAFPGDSTDNPENLNKIDDPMYVMLTSGTTGNPNGVVIEHRNVINYVLNQKSLFNMNPADRVLQFSSLSFDASVEQVWIALLAGAALVLVREEVLLDQELFARYIINMSVTHIHAVPSYLNNLVLHDRGELKRVISGGDICPVELARNLCNEFDFYNKYGPTETTVTSIEMHVKEVGREQTLIPIGKPLQNTLIYILSEYREVVPTGVVGELYIGGEGVARGYLDNPELTAEKFKRAVISHSSLVISSYKRFSKSTNDRSPKLSPNDRLYRTGDLARRLGNGNIEFLGRIDHQVKIRGFRIEPKEIENLIVTFPGIQEAVVIERKDKTDDKFLCAYVVVREAQEIDEPGDASFQVSPDFSEVREKLAENLPGYMIPSHIVRLEKIPLTINGKVDRKSLPPPDICPGEDFVLPQSDLERIVAEIWQDVLGLERVGNHDKFFQVGGNSIKIMQVHQKIKEKMDVDVPVISLFQYTTVSTLADYLEQEKSGTAPSVTLQQRVKRDKSSMQKSYEKRRRTRNGTRK